MDNCTVVYPYNGTSLSNKEKQILMYAIIWVNLKGIVPNERNQFRKVTYICSDSTCMTFLKSYIVENGPKLTKGGCVKKGET